MNRRHGRIWQDIIEVLMSLVIVVCAVFLVMDWEKWEYMFLAAFGAAFFLFLTKGISIFSSREFHKAAGFLYLLGATLMMGFLTASILTLWGGNL